MSLDGPQRTQTYTSDVSASEIWARFQIRPDDVFICTPPKCGTTWMQSICGMLIFGNPQVNPGIGTVSRWLDSRFNEEQEVLEHLQAQSHRRYIKTHTPLDGITYDPQCAYFAVYRHPLDVFFSGQNHLKNMKNDFIKHLILEDVNEGVREWIGKDFTPDQNIGESLASIVSHYQSFAAWRDRPNIHLFHYRDMQHDLPAAVSRVAEILGTKSGQQLVDEIAAATSFSNMKRQAAKFAPSADRDIWKDNAQFFESGSNDKWQGTLTPEIVALYETRMDQMLPAADRQWLENGTRR